MSKLHIYPADAIAQSMLNGVAATAECGLIKHLAAADIDAAVNSKLPVCKGCARSVAEQAKDRDVVLQKPEGWTVFLERRVRESTATQMIRYRLSDVRTWTDFPLAG